METPTASDLEVAIQRYDLRSFEVISTGEIVALRREDRLFLYNRSTRDAFEVRPDFESGILTHYLGKGQL